MALTTYSQYQNLASSEKVALVIIEAKKRLVGWVVHSGSTYKITNFDHPVLVSIEDSGTAYASVGSIGAITAGTYFHDRAAKTVYLRASDSSNPNSRYLVLTFRLYFSNFPIKAPYDLSTGFELEWLPLVESTSDFGVELDNQNQLGVAIEGSGSIKLFNDQSFWKSRFDKLFFENQLALIYSWNPGLPITQAKLLFKGRIQSKTYSESSINFRLKDLLNGLRAEVNLANLESLASKKITPAFEKYKQRRLYGYVSGHKCQNIDQVLAIGYPLTGNVTLVKGTTIVTGSGTQFLKELTPGDKLTADGVGFYSIKAVNSNTDAVLSESFKAASFLSPAVMYVKPSHAKRWTNRKFLIAGHPLRAPQSTIASVQSLTTFTLNDATDFRDGDFIEIVGKTTRVQILRVNGNQIKLASLIIEPPVDVPEVGDTVKRHPVQRVYLDDREVDFDDYTVSNGTPTTITISENAERNLAPPRSLTGTISFDGTTKVTGSGTQFTQQLSVGDWIAVSESEIYHEILRIESDTELYLRETVFTSSGLNADFKKPEIYEEGSSSLTVDCIGIGSTGGTGGTLLTTGPEIVQDLLGLAGLSAEVNTSSFTTAKGIAPYRMGVTIPEDYNATTTPKIRDIINKINQSILGALVQNPDFQFEYSVLSPERITTNITKFRELDVLNFAVETSADRIIRKAIIRHSFKEHDFASNDGSFQTATQTNNIGLYITKTDRELEVQTYLISSSDAQMIANRYAFILELGSSTITLTTKLQSARLKVTDKIDLSYEKLYERLGSTGTRKIAGIQSSRKTISDVDIELEDLTNAFTRCGVITDNSAPTFGTATDEQRLYSGYITDNFGLIGNDSTTHNINLQW